MADNSSRLDALGATESVAADEIGGVKYQRVKVALGADGTAADWREPQDGLTSGFGGNGVMLFNSVTSTWYPAHGTHADGVSGAYAQLSGQALYNGASIDRQRGNTEATLLASASRTATVTSATVTNHNARGVLLCLNISVAPGAQTLTPAVQWVEPTSAATPTLATFPTVSSVGTVAYLLYPGAAETVAVTNLETQALPLPRSWRLVVTHSAAGAWTYSVGYALVL